MGVVYKTSRPGQDGFVALKLLPPDRSSQPDFESRFEREAAVLAALTHRNIVTFLDFGREAAIYFIAMEYVHGETLRHVLDRGPLTFGEAKDLALQMCDALAYAHAKGIVHRDVKPENIMIDSRGCVKLTDFGLAKLAGGTGSLDLTQSGASVGTPRYMAPEQARDARDVDLRADLYSVGIVLHEMLAGEIPKGAFRRALHPGLDDVFAKTLARDRAVRYGTAAELKRDLDRLRTNP